MSDSKMPAESVAATSGEPAKPAPAPAAAGDGFAAITSQEELDRIIGERLARERAKFKGYVAPTDHASEISELREQVGALTDQLQAAKAAEQHAAWVAQAAEKTGVPAELLRGDSLEELTAHGEALTSHFKPAAPVIPSQGDQPDDASHDERLEAVRGLFR